MGQTLSSEKNVKSLAELIERTLICRTDQHQQFESMETNIVNYYLEGVVY